jgi:hypothetical protein
MHLFGIMNWIHWSKNARIEEPKNKRKIYTRYSGLAPVMRFCVHGNDRFEFPNKPVKILSNRMANNIPSEQRYKCMSSCLLVPYLYINAKCAGQLSLNVSSARTGSKILPHSPTPPPPLPYTINLIFSRLRREYFILDSLLFPQKFSVPDCITRLVCWACPDLRWYHVIITVVSTQTVIKCNRVIVQATL